MQMVTRIRQSTPPKLYIREWMETVPGLDQKRLAERMGRTAGAVSKKLAKPSNIDTEWLGDFAWALGVEVPDLFRDPSAPTPAELLAGLSEEQAKEVINFADFVRRKKLSA